MAVTEMVFSATHRYVVNRDRPLVVVTESSGKRPSTAAMSAVRAKARIRDRITTRWPG